MNKIFSFSNISFVFEKDEFSVQVNGKKEFWQETCLEEARILANRLGKMFAIAPLALPEILEEASSWFGRC